VGSQNPVISPCRRQAPWPGLVSQFQVIGSICSTTLLTSPATHWQSPWPMTDGRRSSTSTRSRASREAVAAGALVSWLKKKGKKNESGCETRNDVRVSMTYVACTYVHVPSLGPEPRKRNKGPAQNKSVTPVVGGWVGQSTKKD
jgi:hypothetical protein